jgi:hypothetical protein
MDVRHTTFYGHDPAGVYGRHEIICAPKPHEGIGNALRKAYTRSAQHIPQEFADLLARLD